MSSIKQTKIVIVGGGFGGVKAALELSSQKNCSVTLISDHVHFRYYPGLYHTATGGKRAGSQLQLDSLLKGRGVTFVRATVKSLDRENKVVVTEDGQSVSFDKVIFALGNITNYFGIKGLDEYSYGIKSIEEVERFKKHLHEQITSGGPDLNYVIVGGGPTGIELAGALPEYLRHIMKNHGIQDRTLTISVIEAVPKLLPRSPAKISEAVTKRLENLGITLLVNTAVQGQTADTLMAGDKPIKTQTVVWTAGVTNSPFFKTNNFKLTDRGKVEVDEHLQAEPDIYVIGDNANTMFSGMAQTALYDAEFIAENLTRELHGKTPKAYVPKKPISVIPVGPHWATVEWGKYAFAGFWGWFLHIFVDLVAFHDLESWPKASGQWMTAMSDSDEGICPTCAKE